MGSMGKAAGNGVRWMAVAQLARRLTQVVTTAILAHLLVAGDFGIIGMAAVIIDFALIFRDLGTSTAVIHKENPSDSLLSSVFWVNLSFGLLVAAAVALAAPLIAAFFHEPALTDILRVLSITFVIASSSILQQALLERRLAFEILARLELAAAIIGSATGIAFAVLGFGAWSLVAQIITLQTSQTVFLWVAGRWRPRLLFDWQSVRSIAGYSLNLTGSQVVFFVWRNADKLLIGRFLGSEALGFYTIAYRIMLYPLEAVSHVVGRVLFPVYARFQNDDARFRAAYLRVAGAIAMVTFPLMAGVMALHEPFVEVVLGEGWEPVATLLLILAPIGMSQAVGSTTAMIFQTKGRTDIMFVWHIVYCAVTIGAFALGLPWGIIGVAVAYAAANLLCAYPSFAIPFRLVGLRWREFFKPLAAPFAASLLMALLVYGATTLLTLENHWLLAGGIVSGALLYLFLLQVFDREQLRQIWQVATARRHTPQEVPTQPRV